jgi:hypothetical protein
MNNTILYYYNLIPPLYGIGGEKGYYFVKKEAGFQQYYERTDKNALIPCKSIFPCPYSRGSS